MLGSTRRLAILAVVVFVMAEARYSAAVEANNLRTALESIKAEELKRHVDVLADDTMEGRLAGSRGGQAAGAYIVEQLKRMKLAGAAGNGTFFQSAPNGGRNILALLRGSDPKLSAETIVIGAHYDHVGYGSSQNSFGPIGYIHNGADDNASGTSALLEIAEALTTLPTAPRRSILLAFWDTEEAGMLGSKHWWNNPTLPRESVVLGINLDMVGRLRDGTVQVQGSRSAPGLRRVISNANRDTRLTLDFRWENKANSDHWTFHSAGVPFIMYHTGDHPDYHRPSDDIDKINNSGIQLVSRLTFGTAIELADMPAAPKFRAASRNETEEWQRNRFEQPAAPPPGRFGVTWGERQNGVAGLPLTAVRGGSAADAAGLRSGDRLLRVGERTIDSDNDLLSAVYVSTGKTPLTVMRSGKSEPETVTVDLPGKTPRIGIAWRDDESDPGVVVIVQVLAGSPADLAGMRVYDRLVQVAGRAPGQGDEPFNWFNQQEGPIEIVVERYGRIMPLTLRDVRPVEKPAEKAVEKPAPEKK